MRVVATKCKLGLFRFLSNKTTNHQVLDDNGDSEPENLIKIFRFNSHEAIQVTHSGG